jgi:hypothetical protein
MINVPRRVYFGWLFCTQNIINHLVFWDRHHVKKIHNSLRSQSMTLEPLPKPQGPSCLEVRSILICVYVSWKVEASPVTRSKSTPVNLNIPISWNMLYKRKFYHVRIFPVFIHSFWLRYNFIESKNKDRVGVYLCEKLIVLEHFVWSEVRKKSEWKYWSLA